MLRYNKYIKESTEEDIDVNEQVEQLKHFLGLLFKNSGITAFDIDADGLNFEVYIVLSKVEKLKNMIKILDVCKKLHTDVLIQYRVEFDLWETKAGYPLMTISYLLDEDDEDGEDEIEPF